MEKQLKELARMAQRERAVASGRLQSGLHLMVYPIDDGGAIICIGYDHGDVHRISPEEVLRRRSFNMATCGMWLPSLFPDGSFYVVQHVPELITDDYREVIPDYQVMAAQGLLS